YNRINGTYASEHPELLRRVLRDEWGFDGAVVSDWFGTHSAAESLEASLDLEMPGPPRERGDKLLQAVRDGRTTESRVDESVRRLLQLFDWAGVGETPGEETTDDSPETRALIRRAAIASTVLLKNDGVLPLGDGVGRIALLGPNADRGRIQGGGSAQVRVDRPSLPLAAMQARGLDMVFEPGCRIEKRLSAMRGNFTVHYQGLDGATAEEHTDRINFIWMDDPAPGIDRSAFGLTAHGTFVPDVTGDWTVSFTAVGSSTLRIDGEMIVDLTVPQTGGAYFGLGSQEIRVTVPCEAGVSRDVDVTMEVEERAQMRGLRVGAQPPANDDAMERAVAAAATASTAVIVVGTTSDWETEGEDRTTMDLPGRQDELIQRVAAVNPRTIVVINAGSPVSMPWLDDVAAVLQVWFPGEEMGEALVDVLLGVAEPGGRLPTTIPHRLSDTPAFAHYPGTGGMTQYAEGLLIGHRWYDANGIEPLFPFGHGLGYTTWELGETTLAGSIADGLTVTVPVRNIGARGGSTVVQVYVEPPAGTESADPARPQRTLRGFAKVTATPGATVDAVVHLPWRAFARWDESRRDWVVDAGEHGVRTGLSSRSLGPTVASRAPAPA
ncbi:MAG TPA: glycoside hydrolase family 3 C-terminal domain-containing protein, partial [Ilumatobacteraceae bacterium]|nr:glycoside hydrolase family 3 C-terminal domain-containing protein [Ilumatobacteraceae bacterium]